MQFFYKCDSNELKLIHTQVLDHLHAALGRGDHLARGLCYALGGLREMSQVFAAALSLHLGRDHQLGRARRDLLGTHHQLLKLAFSFDHLVCCFSVGGK